MRINGVIFSLNGTLIDYGNKILKQGILECMQERGYRTNWEDIEPIELQGHHGNLAIDEQFIQFCQEQCRTKLSHQEIKKIQDEIFHRIERKINHHLEVCPGIQELVSGLRDQGIKIAVIMDYPKSIGETIVNQLENKGITIDCWASSDDIYEGRPYPWMVFQIASMLNSYPINRLLRVGSTAADIEEGIAAGLWTVATIFDCADMEEKAESFYLLGADYVVGTAEELAKTIDKINNKLERCH